MRPLTLVGIRQQVPRGLTGPAPRDAARDAPRDAARDAAPDTGPAQHGPHITAEHPARRYTQPHA